MANLHSAPNEEALKRAFIGKSLKDIATPAAVLELGKLKNNCSQMLEAVKTLDFGWRAHIKTHKTVELTKLQVGEHGPVNIIVSTLLEAENIPPFMIDCKKAGRPVNLLYSFPVTPVAIDRLSVLNKALGLDGLSVMVDNAAQIACVVEIYQRSFIAPSIFIKIDMGGRRAGVIPQTPSCDQLVASVLELNDSGSARLLGLYSHAGHSYSSNSSSDALDYLRQEFESLLVTALTVHSLSPTTKLVLSVGATPTTTSVRNLLVEKENTIPEEAKAIAALRATIATIRSHNCDIEIHAGVYPILDLQQLATQALPTEGPHALLTWSDLALTVVAEVASLYPGRGKDGGPEALVGSGSLALGREPCKAYSGWGIVTPWNREAVMPSVSLEKHDGWQVGRISQEHGILSWKGGENVEPLEVGQKVRIWPNHACITGAGYEWYLVVDGSDDIIDVWPRWRGW